MFTASVKLNKLSSVIKAKESFVSTYGCRERYRTSLPPSYDPRSGIGQDLQYVASERIKFLITRQQEVCKIILSNIELECYRAMSKLTL